MLGTVVPDYSTEHRAPALPLPDLVGLVFGRMGVIEV